MSTSTTSESLKIFNWDLEYWMTNLPQKLRSTPIIYLAIPGSHDSFTSNITKDSKLSPDAERLIRSLKFLGPILRFAVSKWSKTQNFDVVQQLKNGIRYFDLRLATRKSSEKFYFVHGQYSTEVQAVLNEIEMFLVTHPQEIVILDCQHFYNFTQTNHETLMHLFEQIFGHKMLPYTPYMENLSLEYMTSQFRYQVIVIYRSEAARFGQPLLWPSKSFPNPWPNTDKQLKLIRALNYGIANRPHNTGYISQLVLTPSSWFVIKHIFSSLKEKCAIEFDKIKYDWISQQTPGIGGVNIIICDFIDLNESFYCKEVVSLNERLLNNSTKSESTILDLTPVD